EVTTMVSVNAQSSSHQFGGFGRRYTRSLGRALAGVSRGARSSADPGEMQVVAAQPGLHRRTVELGWNGFKFSEHTGNRHELGVEFLTEHPRGGLAVCACHH